jgi:predicted permease
MPRPDEELPLSPLKPVDEDVRQEIRDHIERRTDDLVAQGWTVDQARAEAIRVFGDVGEVSAECREITSRARRSSRRIERLDGLLHDVRFALRLLRRSPTFAIVAIATLALGVGANSAIFSLINGVILRPLPYSHGEQLVDVAELHRKGWSHLPYANFVDIRAQSRSFQQLAEFYENRSTVLGANVPIRATTAYVTGDFFPMMRAPVELGRLTTTADHQLGAAPVAVISDRFWREHFAGNRDLASLRLRGEFNMQVVGVVAPGFGFPDDADIWVPLELEPQATSRTAHNAAALGRLRDGVTAGAAQQEVSAVLRHVGETAGLDFDAIGARVTSLHADQAGSTRTPLLLLLGASGLLLLTACTNLASTLLARGTARQQELAVRTAIGAGRARVLRQIFTESLVIAVLGCGTGLLLAEGLLRGMALVAPPEVAVMQSARLDLTVVGFTAATALITAVLFGFLPGLRMSDVDTGQLMRGSRGGSARRSAIWSALVAVQVALAVILLIGSGLLIRSFARVMQVELGFDPTHVLTVATDLPEQNYPDVQQAVRFHDRMLALVRAIPGVQAAGVTLVPPLVDEGPSGGIEVEGKPPVSPAYPSTGHGVYQLASVGFFPALGVRIVRGRDFAETDDAASLPVVIVNQQLAEKEWPGEDPIGKRFRESGMDAVTQVTWATVIGVARDVPGSNRTGRPAETYYYSYRQLPNRARFLTAVVRSSLPTAQLERAVRAAIDRVDPNVPAEFGTMPAVVAASVASRRFMVLLLGLFATVALLLAAVGIYGVVAYSVAQRTREIGIRIALGAAPASVGRMVQLRAMLVVLAGIAIGVAGAFAATRLLRSLLYGVTATDPLAFGGVIVLLVVIAWLASWAPARRGTRIDPVVAIRAE